MSLSNDALIPSRPVATLVGSDLIDACTMNPCEAEYIALFQPSCKKKGDFEHREQ